MTTRSRPPSPPVLTGRQEERRRRILRAAAELARDGGFDAVQMRGVAESSGVALGTLYRYFPSKIHLLVAVMRDRLEQLHGALRRRPPRGRSPSDRVAGTLMRAFRVLRREPLLADAMLRAFTFADRSVSTEVDAVSRLTAAIVLDAVGAQDAPAPERLSAVRVVGHAWHATLVGWLSGRVPTEQVRADVETACRLLDAPPGHGGAR